MVCCFEEMSQLGGGGAGHCGQCVLHELVTPLGSIAEVTQQRSWLLLFIIFG